MVDCQNSEPHLLHVVKTYEFIDYDGSVVKKQLFCKGVNGRGRTIICNSYLMWRTGEDPILADYQHMDTEDADYIVVTDQSATVKKQRHLIRLKANTNRPT